MICFIKGKHKLYKKTLFDAWGHHWIYDNIKSKALNYVKIIKKHNSIKRMLYRREFVYNFAKRIKYRKRKRWPRWYLFPRLLKSFYLVLSADHFRRYYRKASYKTGYFLNNFFAFIECRIFMIVYRVNFITNIFMIKHIIDKRFFLVNFKPVTHCNCEVRAGDFITIKKKYEPLIKNDMLLRFKNNIIFFKPPIYFYINYNFMFVVLRKYPKYRQFRYPCKKINIYVGIEFFYPFI